MNPEAEEVVDAVEDAVELDQSDEEMLVEEISIDGMCGVY